MSIADSPLLSLKGIRKVFPGCIANDAIDLEVHPGQIHALLGENGADVDFVCQLQGVGHAPWLSRERSFVIPERRRAGCGMAVACRKTPA